MTAEAKPDDARHASLAEVLDRVLGKGAVIAGEVTISVADVDLVRLSLQLVLGSADVLPGLPRITPLPKETVVKDEHPH